MSGHNDQNRGDQPMTRRRGRAWRTVLPALAGSGLTAAGLGGPLAGGALAADASASTAPGGEGATAPVTTPAPTTPAPAAGTPGSAEQPANTSATTTPQPSTPQPSAPQPSTPPQSTSQPAATPVIPAVEAPTVVIQRRQKTTKSKRKNPTLTATHGRSSDIQPTTGSAHGPTTVAGANGVAPSPQTVAAQAGALAAELATSEASVQALGFYRIPLFLLPIYRAAAIQYGVPWQILAAINEVETDYGSDLSVSSAGAEGWMQFEPSTWLQYGVDALDAGYADPYNPVDAIFAAARYLHAAGAAKDLRTAILAYNHSEAYASSVLLRAKLISSYPKSVIATLTGLVDARLPVTGKKVEWSAVLAPAPSSATANAKAVPDAAKPGSSDAGEAAHPVGASGGNGTSAAAAAVPGAAPAPSPRVAASGAASTSEKTDAAPQFVELTSAKNASVVAVQDGRILGLGSSHRLGKYVILRDIDGDVFTYAGLGSIAPSYRLPKVPSAALIASARAAAASAAATSAAAGSAKPASAGSDSPVTLQVKRAHGQTAKSQDSVPAGSAESVPAATGKVRLFANPGNPDALAAAARVTTSTPAKGSGHGLALRRGSLVAEGTVLGRVSVPKTARDGHLRFAVQPAQDTGSIDPGTGARELERARRGAAPAGGKGADRPARRHGERRVPALQAPARARGASPDPDITLPARARHEVAAGVIDRRVLAVLAFLSRSGPEADRPGAASEAEPRRRRSPLRERHRNRRGHRRGGRYL